MDDYDHNHWMEGTLMSLIWHKAGHEEGECGGEMECPWCKVEAQEAKLERLMLALRRIYALNDHTFNLGDAMGIAKAALDGGDTDANRFKS